MALPTASDNEFPKVILEEVANDGSATVTPAADHRALFLGEDGELHVKDSSGTVTSPVPGFSGDAGDVPFTPAGDIAATDVQAAIEELDGEKGAASLLNDHNTRHENGGDDEISVAGLSGELADAQPPKDHNHTGSAGDGGDLDSPVIDGYAVFNEESDPATADAGTVRLFAKDGAMYSIDDTGTVLGPFDEAGEGGGTGPATISGGTKTSAGGFDYHAFTSSGDLTVSAEGVVDVLLVGGGGGGGSHSGGGGGGGDVLFLEDVFVEASTVAVVVGAGGTGHAASFNSTPSGPGLASKFGSLLFAAGGGGGGWAFSSSVGTGNDEQRNGLTGSSGGGGCLRQTNAGGVALGGGGNGGNARSGNTSGTGAGGGGGGAGGAGGVGSSGDVGGTGGDGRDLSSLFASFGASGFFGGGGGGGAVNTGTGGTGTHGGGNGGTGATGSSATANTGSGGGGGGNNGTTPFAGGDGGSGIVIVRVPTP